MVAEVSKTLTSMFIELFKIVDTVFSELEGWNFYLSAFIIFTVSRFLLVPFLRGGIGGLGSDIVKKIARESSDVHNESKGFSDKAKGEK